MSFGRTSHLTARIAGKASWNLVDQVLSAASNLALTVVMARATDAIGFGAFSAAFLVYSLVIGLARSAFGQPLQVRATHLRPEDTASVYGAAVAAGLGAGAFAGVMCAISSIFLGGTSSALLGLGICMPALLMQDCCRFVSFSKGEAKKAAQNDALWALLSFGALALLVRHGERSQFMLTLAWGGGGVCAGLYGLRQHCIRPRLLGAFGWAFRQRDISGYFTAEFFLGQGFAITSTLLVGLLASAAGLGSFRASQVLLGPLNIIGTAAFTYTIPEVARNPQLGSRQRLRISWVVAGIMGAVATGYGAAVVFLPGSLGVAMFGATWPGARELLPAVAVGAVINSLATGPAAVLYGMGRARTTFALHLITAPLMPVGILLGFALNGVLGAAWGVALTQVLSAPLWFFRVSQVVHKLPGTTEDPHL